MSKQLELFNLSPFTRQEKGRSYNHWEWEQEEEERLFDNRPKPPPEPNKEKPPKVFDNPRHLTELAVSEYTPGGTAGKTKTYFRFSYKEKNRTRHIHIKGGNSESKLAIERKEKIESWILQSLPLVEIIRRIKAW